jgi:two-component system LytT family response regulator
MKRIAIIDDEQDARQMLRTIVTSMCPDVEICGEADSVESAYVLIRQTNPHGILLDIAMGDGTGFDLLAKFPNPEFQVIFTTAYDEFALKAFRFHALDYLLKPINPVELSQSIDRIKKDSIENLQTRMGHLLESVRTNKVDTLTLTSQEGMIFLKLDQIAHLESDASYTTFHLANKESHLISRPMKDFETLLPVENFFKLHQSFIINLNYVKKILREDGGYALLETGSKIPIARRRKNDFFALLKNRFPM